MYSNARFLYRYHRSSTSGGVDGIWLEESVLETYYGYEGIPTQ